MRTKITFANDTALAGGNVTSGEENSSGPNPAAPINEKAQAEIVINREFNIHFKKDKLGQKEPSFKLVLPVPTKEGVSAALNDEKQLAYILDVLADQTYNAAREQVNDAGVDGKPVRNQENLDVSKITLEYLANLPPATRRGGGIAKETWEEFGKDYASIMPALTNKSEEQIGNAVAILLKRFQPVKSNKKVVAYLKEQLALYFLNTTNQEDMSEVVEFLDKKADEFLAADEESLLQNL